MRLELGDFPVREAAFGAATEYRDGTLTLDRDELLALVREDGRVLDARLDLAAPGESTRIVAVDDLVPAMVKVDGPGQVYPGVVGRPIETVGSGRTHRLTGFAVVECLDDSRQAVDSVTRRIRAESGSRSAIDMSGPGAGDPPGTTIPYSGLRLLVLTLEVDGAGGHEAHDEAKRGATFRLADRIARTVAAATPPSVETLDLSVRDPSLPGAVFVANLRSSEHHVGPRSGIGTAVYGITRLSAPWLLGPTEILDGAVTRKTTWYQSNNPVVLEMCRRHGRDLNFLGAIVQRTNWTSLPEKQLAARRVGELAAMLGARGAIVTVDIRGNRFIEAMYGLQACEQRDVRAVLLTVEEPSEGGQAPPLIFSTPEVQAVASCGDASVPGPFPAVERVLGAFARTAAMAAERPGEPGGHTARYWPDYYGWGRQSSREF
jgi:sarcosine reductase